jgi:hypothetical protein
MTTNGSSLMEVFKGMPISYSEKEIPTFEVNDNHRVYTSSSSKGNQPKWLLNNKIWLKGDYLGFEGLAETLSSNILLHSNIKYFVEYNICKIEDLDDEGGVTKYFGCYSRDFKESLNIVTLNKYLYRNAGLSVDSKDFRSMEPEKRIELVVSLVEKEIPNFGIWLTSLFEFDAFILNEDRHFNNIILLVDSKTGIHSTAPFFDCGAGFCSDTLFDYKLTEPVSIVARKVKAKPFSSSFQKQVKYMRQLYGPQLKLRLPETFRVDTILYSKEIVDRVNALLRFQRSTWRDMFYY